MGEPVILKYQKPVAASPRYLATTDELRKMIPKATGVLIRYTAGPNQSHWMVVTKKEALNRLKEFPGDALHYCQEDRGRIILGVD